MIAGSTGCASFNRCARKSREFFGDFMIEHRNYVMAEKAWFREQGHHCNRRYPAEFKAGFLAGYAEIANGGPGCCPSVAPTQYWGWRYQSPDGRSAVDSWFSGFPLGVRAAERDGIAYWGNLGPSQAQAAPAPAPVPPAPSPVPGAMPPLPQPQEIIVPGSEKIISEKIVPGSQRDFPNELPPAPSETKLPALDAPALPLPTDDASNGSPAKDIVFAPAKVSVPPPILPASTKTNRSYEQTATPETFTLNDLGEDSIDGIFESLEIPTDVQRQPGEPDAPQTGTSKEAVLESASGEIPFKFE